MKLRLGMVVLALCASSFAQENYAQWTKYKNIVVNTKASGANVANSVAKFPVLVRLNATNAADVFTGAQAGGADIRFANAAGAARPYQIESWDATAQTAAIWVLADTVKGNDSSFALRLYWGKASAPNLSNGPAVFDTAADWRAVYHMNGGAGSTTELDATVHGVNLAASDSVSGAVPGDTIGMVGRARVFAGDTLTPAGRQYFVAPGTAQNPAVNLRANASYSISAWMYARTISGKNGHGNSVINKGDRQYAMQIYGATAPTAKQFEAATYTSTWRQAKSKGTTLAAAGQWYHITGTWTGGANATTGTGKLYVNGVLDSTTSMAIGTANPDTVYNLFVGANPSAGSNSTAAGTTKSLASGISANPRFWNGYLDELSISRGVRSDDFVKLSYETQKSTATAIALGSTQTQAVVADTVKNIYYVMQGTGNAPRDTLVFQTGTPVNLTLKYTGGPVDSIKVTTGTLPAGLTVNLLTGTLSGTPTALAAAGNQTLSVYSSLGTVTRGLRISVVAGPLKLNKYSQDTATYTVGIPVTNAPQLGLGRAATKYSVSPALPAGIVIDTVSGVISGTPSAVTAAANYTVKAMNATDTSSRNLRFTVVANSEVYTTWANHRPIYLNTANNSNGVKISANVVKFPVAVRIPGNDSIFRQVLAGAADLRFTKADNATFLPYQIEQWDSAKAATIWVLVDTVKANSLTQNIVMHWGKAGSTSLSNGSSVFSVANGFQAVWHMGAGTGNEIDATANGFVAEAFLAPGDSTGGAVGKARKFDGATQYFQVQNSVTGALDFGLDQNYTLSAWANPNTIPENGNGMKLVEKGDDQWTLAVYNSANPKYWEITTKLNNGAATWAQCTSEAAAITAESGVNKWNHVVGTYRGAAVGGTMAESLFVNGVFMATRSETISSLTTSRTTTRPVNIGVMSTGVGATGLQRFWTGMLDEVRLQSAVRSPDWIALEYGNQRPVGQNLVSFSLPTSLNGKSASASVDGSLGLNVKSVTNGLVFGLQGAKATDKATLSLVDMWGRTVFSGSFANGSQLSWNGVSNNGQSVSAGIYVARVTVIDGVSGLRKVLESRVPFTK